jgi:hypothetical protein
MREAVEHYNRDPTQGTTVPPPLWNAVFVDEIVLPEHSKYQSRSIREIADELGVAPADAMLDLALAEDLGTKFRWRTESPEWAAAVGEAQRDARMMIGVSDGGAHLARDDGADWSSYFLRSWVLDRKVWTLEEGIPGTQRVDAIPLHPGAGSVVLADGAGRGQEFVEVGQGHDPFALHRRSEVEEGAWQVGQAPVEVRTAVRLDEFVEGVAGDRCDGDPDQMANQAGIRFQCFRQAEVDFDRVQGSRHVPGSDLALVYGLQPASA